MDMITYMNIKNETRKQIEEELNRELTENEIEVFNKASKIIISKCNKINFYNKHIR